MNYGIGIDVGGTTCKMGLFTEEGKLDKKWEIKTRTEEHGSHILEDLAAEVVQVLQEFQIKNENLLGIGMGVPGPVDERGIVLGCVNLGWPVIDAGKVLGQLTGFPVFVANDANVAAMGEMWKGSGKGTSSLVMITLGTGVGGGMIQQGRILSGSHGAGGEVGHLLVNLDETESCNCGRKGCLEQYASATGIVNMAKKMGMKENEEPISAKMIYDQAAQGDPLSLEVVRQVGDILGRAMANLAVCVDPEVFLIGGGVSKAGDILLRTVQEGYQKHAFYTCQKTPIRVASLGNDAGIYGAMRMILV